MFDFSTWASAIGEFLGGLGGEALPLAGGLGEGVAGSIPSVAQDFGGLLGGLLGGGVEGGADTVGGFLPAPAVSGPITDLGMTPAPIAAASPFDTIPRDEFMQFNFGSPQAAGGTVALNLPQQMLSPELAPGAQMGITLPMAGAAGVAPSAAGGAENLLGNVPGFLRDNYKWMLPALGIGYSALRPKSALPGEAEMAATAARTRQMGERLTDPLLTGQLPAGYQSALDRMQQGAEASIRSKYAQMGLSGSSMERSELAAVPQQMETQKLQIANNLAQQGMQALGFGDQAYARMANLALSRDKELSNALAAFGAAAMRA